MIISVFKLCIFCISHHLLVSFLLRVKVNSTNWSSPNVWVFIAQLVEHCSANSEAMGLNPVEVPNFFSGLFAIGLLHLEVMTNASFQQWLGILLRTKIDRAHKNYVTPEIWEEMHLREIFLWHFDFSTKYYGICRHVGGHTQSCPPTWLPKLLFACILLNIKFPSDVL